MHYLLEGVQDKKLALAPSVSISQRLLKKHLSYILSRELINRTNILDSPFSVLFLDDQDVQIAEQIMKKWDEQLVQTIWECLNCGYTSKKHYNVKEHVRVKHLGSREFKCDFCDQICPSRGAHRAHVWRYHKQN